MTKYNNINAVGVKNEPAQVWIPFLGLGDLISEDLTTNLYSNYIGELCKYGWRTSISCK